MVQQVNLETQRLFPSTLKGQVLVVSPAGDAAGYGMAVFNREFHAIQEAIKKNKEIKHLLVNFENANYFGSDVIGAITALGNTVREKDGVFAVTNLSDDMTGVMGTMQLTELYTEYESEKAALAVLSPGYSRSGGSFKLIFVTLFIVLVVGGAAWGGYKWWKYEDERDNRQFTTLMKIYGQTLQKRNGNTTDTQWQEFRKDSLKEVQRIHQELRKTASDDTPGDGEMLAAIEDGFLKLLVDPKTPHPEAEAAIDKHMKEARRIITGKVLMYAPASNDKQKAPSSKSPAEHGQSVPPPHGQHSPAGHAETPSTPKAPVPHPPEDEGAGVPDSTTEEN